MIIVAHGDELYDETGFCLPEVGKSLHDRLKGSGRARNVIVNTCGRAIEGDHFCAFSFQQAGDGRRDQRAVGVQGIGKRTARDHIENIDEIRTQHGFAAGNQPPAAPQRPGLTHNPADLIKGKLPFLNGAVCRHPQPAVAAVAVAAVGQIDVAFEGQAWDVFLASDDVRLSIQE